MLYICATPIGNLEDITYRAVRILGEVDLIAAEDTRNTVKLLNHYGIRTPMTSYHEHNKYEKAEELVRRMLEGSRVALVTDAGTPAISDPGEELVRACVEAGIEVTSLPGPAACVTALTLSALPARRFCFEAFLPEKGKERRRILRELKGETRTVILYEAPHNLKRTVDDLLSELGDRQVAVCRELTKIHEEVERTTLKAESEKLKTEEARGEYVLVIRGAAPDEKAREEQEDWKTLSLAEHVAMYEDQGMDRREAVRQAAADRGMTRREVYQEFHGLS